MKKKILYPLLTSVLVIAGVLLLVSMTKKSSKISKPLTTVSLSLSNHSSATVTKIKVNAGADILPIDMPCSCYPTPATNNDNTITVYFSSSFTGAIQIVDADLNPLGCSASGTGTSRSIPHCPGSTSSAVIHIYTAQGCP